jgi:multidrug resistance efflux pump
MTAEMNMARKATHDMLESRIKTVEAKLETMLAQAETAKAKLEIKAIAELLTQKHTIQQKLKHLKKLRDGRWEHAKADIEAQIAAFEKSVSGGVLSSSRQRIESASPTGVASGARNATESLGDSVDSTA